MPKTRMSIPQLLLMGLFIVAFMLTCFMLFPNPSRPLWQMALIAGLAGGIGQYVARKFLPNKESLA